jgi:hypothetical protein
MRVFGLVVELAVFGGVAIEAALLFMNLVVAGA